MTANTGKSNNIIPILIALANLGVFGTLFLAMGYFELIGSDAAYFDQGTYNNLKIINSVLSVFGFSINPEADLEVTTRGYAICYGLALISASFAITFALRPSRDDCELTDAKK